MNRRGFLGLFGGAVAGIALDQAIPFNRVWSFPKQIIVPEISLAELKWRYLEPAVREMTNRIDQLCAQGVLGRCAGFEYEEEHELITLTTVFQSES